MRIVFFVEQIYFNFIKRHCAAFQGVRMVILFFVVVGFVALTAVSKYMKTRKTANRVFIFHFLFLKGVI